MENQILLKKPLWQMTGEEFLELQKSNSSTEIKTLETGAIKKYVYGIKGIASLLGCSISKTNRLKKSGKISEAIYQDGRKIIVDADKALELLKKNNKIGR